MSTELTGLAVSVVLMSLPPTPSSLSVASNASGSHYVNVPTLPFVRSVSHGRAFQIQQELLRARPPAYPVRLPRLPTTRWQGTTTLIGFLALAEPTARMAARLPIASASWA